MTLSPRQSRRGFTLVELLVVLTIIGLLMAILVPTAFVVLKRARNTQIALEVASLAQSVEAYKLEAGDYPPNFQDWQVVKRHVLKRWQALQPGELDNFKRLCSGGFGAEAAPSNPVPIDPAEALVFWLGGQSPNGFLKDNQVAPLSATGGEAKSFHGFDQARLTDRDGDGWRELPSPSGMGAPYVYFDARSYVTYYPAATQFALTSTSSDPMDHGTPRPMPRVASPSSQESFVNPTTYQILAAGQDGHFGTGGQVYPDGPYLGGPESDNITNFSEGQTLQDRVP
jgi:prepilin-type N-terminal cleavage/methylation domain-containing protein